MAMRKTTRGSLRTGDGDGSCGAAVLDVTVVSFGYKEGDPPPANMVFDVRFLQNPYWVERLRPLTGRDAPVREYVVNQQLAADFLESLKLLLGRVLPQFIELEIPEFSIAFGCTGGQHRSTALAETLADWLAAEFPQVRVRRAYRELEGRLSEPAGGAAAEDV